MSSPLEGLEPELLWQHFDAIRQIPRPSKHEEKIAEHVAAWARDRGWEISTDEAGSMVIRVPASDGHEGAETVEQTRRREAVERPAHRRQTNADGDVGHVEIESAVRFGVGVGVMTDRRCVKG